jgi:putative nucleotidyltransferase with HDIG domain
LGALRALDKLKLPWYIKLAALYHDCGKSKWEISDEGKRRFTNHATFGAQLVEGDLRRLKFPEGIISIVKTLVCYHMSHMNDREDIHIHSLRKVKAKFDEMNIPFKYFFWIRYADNMGSAVKLTDFKYYWKVYRLALKALNPPHIPSVKDLDINGYDIMNTFPEITGKGVGFILRKLFDLWSTGQIENEHSTLLNEAKNLYKEWSK